MNRNRRKQRAGATPRIPRDTKKIAMFYWPTLGFWRQPLKNWWFWIITICFLIEAPFLACMHDPGEIGYRRIHGINALHVFASKVFGVSTFHNLIGWLFDFDKIVAYFVTGVAFYALSRCISGYLQWTQRADKQLMAVGGTTPEELQVLPKSEASPWPRSVIFGALAGACLISIHYVISGSQHYFGDMDKGLFSAVQHLWRGGFDIGWLSLLGYRLSYLILAPVCYFILFATTSMALMLIWRANSLLRLMRRMRECKETPAFDVELCESIEAHGRANIRRLMTVVLLPAGMLFLLHHVLSYSFGLGQYGASWDTGRFWILIVLYIQAIVALVVGGWQDFIKSRSAFLVDLREHRVAVLSGWFIAVMLWCFPTFSPLLDIRKSNFNIALGVVADWGDASVKENGVSRVSELEPIVEKFVHRAWYPKANCIQFESSQVDNQDYRAFLVLAATLFLAGQSPDSVVSIIDQSATETTTAAQDPRCSKIYKTLGDVFDYFQRQRGQFWRPDPECDDVWVVLNELADVVTTRIPSLVQREFSE